MIWAGVVRAGKIFGTAYLVLFIAVAALKWAGKVE